MEAHTTEIVQELATEKTRLTGKNVRDYGTPSVNERKKDMERERVDCPTYSSYRRITHSSWHFPPAGKSWKEVFKRLLQLKFWPSSRSNAIHTNKYTILNFVPKNLFEQFHRFANIYFLFVLIINLIPAIGAYAKEITWIPLAFVLAVTAIKDGFEDVRRYYSDREINTRICQVFDRAQCKFINTKWKDVIVGDFVKLSCDEVIPADMLMLQTTNENDLCYIQTSNLDGETTLKSREAPVGILDHDDSNCDSFQHVHFTGQLFYEQPNKVIHEFKGFM
jgi:magnesium-transporting ATPase (P-type)